MLHCSFVNENTFRLSVKSIFVIILCILNFMFLSALIAFVISKTDFNYEILNIVISAIFAASSFVNGFAASRLYKENGLICGIFTALVLLIFTIILSVYFGCFSFTNILVIKVSIIFIAGVSGGIVGVNTN